jgi:thiol-disulfide isomerase/thioredoxin
MWWSTMNEGGQVMKQIVRQACVAGLVAVMCVLAGTAAADTTTEPASPGRTVTEASETTNAERETNEVAGETTATDPEQKSTESTAPAQWPAIRLLGPDGQRLTTGSVWVSPEADGWGALPAAQIPMDQGEFRPKRHQITTALGSFLAGMMRSDDKDSLRVFAMAPGLVPSVVTGWAVTSGPLEVKLRPAKRIKLRLQTADGKDLTTTGATVFAGDPDHWIVPSVAGQGFVWPLPFRHFNEATEEAPGVYAFDADPESTVAAYVDAPGHIRYWAVPALPSDEVRRGEVVLRLPEPARLKARIEPETPVTGRKPFQRLRVVVRPSGQDVLAWFGVENRTKQAETETTGTTLQHEFTDLAPGAYLVTSYAQHPRGWLSEGKISMVDSQQVDLAAGDNPPVTAQYWLKSVDRYRGDFAATVKVLRADGSPAAGAEYRLQLSDALYGPLEVARGVTPDSGELRFENLSGVTETVFTTAPEARRVKPYDLVVSGTEVGRLRMYKFDDDRRILEPLGDGVREKTFEFRLPPLVGDPAPDVVFASVTEEGGTLRLSELKGQVVFIDFWATWCGPCQGPMASLNDLAREKADEWAGKVTLLGASIDDARETVLRHIRRKKWTDVKQYWCGEDGPENPATVYGVRGVPTCFLIGRDGRILWSGHPAQIDKHKKIEEALAQP